MQLHEQRPIERFALFCCSSMSRKLIHQYKLLKTTLCRANASIEAIHSLEKVYTKYLIWDIILLLIQGVASQNSIFVLGVSVT